MCGISGIIYKNEQSINSTDIKKMTDIIKHRGPDDDGVYNNKNIFFGHRRLSIIDLSSHGHQPMEYKHNDSSYILTFNGEIYNYLELKSELEVLGYQFNTHTDSEVILAAYDMWGKDCLNHFNGMWAFAILDQKSNKIFMSRDRFGIKPFYYYQNNDAFYFGSEIKQFCEIDSFQAVLNKSSAVKFLINGELNTSEETFFENVYELKGGHYIEYTLDNHNIDLIKWYHIEQVKPNNYNFHDATKKFYEYFNASVNLRLRSDVKLGCLLSGGLDSSAIVSMVDKININKIETISSCFTDKKYDEQEYIDEIIKTKNVNPHKIFPNLSELFSLDVIDQLIWFQDQPIASSSHFAEYLVFKSAKENHLKVVLDGQGSDETLAGYHEFIPVYLWELILNFQFMRLYKEFKYLKAHHNYSKLNLFKMLVLHIIPENIENILRSLFGRPSLPDWIDLKGIKKDQINLNKIKSLNIFDFSLNQLLVKSVPYQLHSEDRNSMAHSIESRLPFLDYQLVEFIMSLSYKYKINKGTTKYVLRESLKDILPEKIKNRQNKMGFVTPEEVWMRENQDMIKIELNNAIHNSNNLISPKIINDFDEMIQGKRRFSRHYFRIISFSRWINTFNVKVN